MKKYNIKIFALGRLVSLLGTYMYQFAAGLYVLKLTGSGSQFAITLIMGTLPRVILAPFAGVVADWMSRKLIVVITDLISGGVLLILLGLTMGRGISVIEIYLSMIALTACNTFFDVAIEAAKPGLVDTEGALEKINAISYGIHSFTSIAGPILGGVVYALVTFKVFVFINGVSFILSGLSESLLHFNLEDIEVQKEKFMEALGGGMRYLKNNKVSIALMSFSISINFCLTMSLSLPMPYLMNNVFHLDPEWVGVVNAGFPSGYLLGTLIINARGVDNRGRVYQIGTWAIWAGMLAIAITTVMQPFIGVYATATIITIFLASIGTAIAFIDIPLMSLLQTLIPSQVRGRVFSVMTMASRLAMPAAMLLSGFLLNRVHPIYLIGAGTGLYLIVLLTICKSVYFKEYIETNTIELVYKTS